MSESTPTTPDPSVARLADCADRLARAETQIAALSARLRRRGESEAVLAADGALRNHAEHCGLCVMNGPRYHCGLYSQLLKAKWATSAALPGTGAGADGREVADA